MAYRTFIVRAVDGFPLAEAHGEAVCTPGGRGETAAREVRQLFQRLNSMPSAHSSVEQSGGFISHIRMIDGVCYLGLFCMNYPHNAAFAFLEEVRIQFQEELKLEFGTCAVDYRSHIEYIKKPYHFVRFERHINRIVTQWRDPSSSFVLGRLHSGANQVSHVMKCNVNDLMFRAEPFGHVEAPRMPDSPKKAKSTSGLYSCLSPETLKKLLIALFIVVVIALQVFLSIKYKTWAPLGLSLAGLIFAYACRMRLAGRRVEAALREKLKQLSEHGSEHLHML